MALTTAERDKRPKKNFARPSVGKATPAAYSPFDKQAIFGFDAHGNRSGSAYSDAHRSPPKKVQRPTWASRDNYMRDAIPNLTLEQRQQLYDQHDALTGGRQSKTDTAADAATKTASRFFRTLTSKEALMSRNVELHEIARELGVMARVPGPDRLREAAYKIAALSPLMGAGIGAGIGGVGGYLASHDSDPDHPNSGLGGALAGAAGGAALGGGAGYAASHLEDIGKIDTGNADINNVMRGLHERLEAIETHMNGGVSPHYQVVKGPHSGGRDQKAMDRWADTGPAVPGELDLPRPAAESKSNAGDMSGKEVRASETVKQAQRLYEFCRRVGCDEESIKRAFAGR